jgi:hypothetical protein
LNRTQVDFEVTGRAGDTVALIEVKNVPSLTPLSAAELRRGLREDDPAIAIPAFFLIVSQDKTFLWEPEQSDANDAEPAATFPMRPILREYLTDHLLDQPLRGAELDIAVLQWLSDITRGRGGIPLEQSSVKKFAERLRGGDIHGGQRL